jgi:preprotein translocase subunit SecD
MNFDSIKYLLKRWQVLLVLICVAGSLIIIAPSPEQKGVTVTTVSSDSPFFGKVQVGETITWANEKDINSPDDLYAFSNYTGSFRFMHNGKLDVISIDQPGLGLSFVKKQSSNLQFGMDLVGGTRVLLKPKGEVTDATIQQISSILETRINVFGLKEATFQPIKDFSGNNYIQIEMAGGSKEEIENLLAKQGFFEGKIPKIITFTNNTGILNLKGNYSLILDNDSIKINNTELKINESSQIEGMPFQVTNVTNDSAVLFFTVFTGNDIQSVCLQDQPGICTSRILMVQGGYEFDFQVFITKHGAENFAAVTKDMKIITDPNSGSKYLDSKIYLYLDENLITSLSISSELKGQAYTTPAITGMKPTRDEALKEQLTLKSILQSGALPTTLEIIRVDTISPALGNEFIQATELAAIVAAIAVSCVIYIRYRKLKILIPNMMWSFFEVVITLGVAAVIKWTIDLSSIAGIIAAIGEGTNEQTMMIDEVIQGGSGEEDRLSTLKQRLKRAFFIIVGTGSIIMMSVVPMIFIGIGVMKGFAVTTLIGTFIGTILTRPAFSITTQKLLEKDIQKPSEKTEKETKKEEKVEKDLEKKIETDAKKEDVNKEEVIKKEWNKLMDMAAKELFKKPYKDLTPEEKEEVKKLGYEAEKKETK